MKYYNTYSHAIALSIMHLNKCNLTVLLHLYPISNEQKSVGKITDENVLLFSSQTKFALQKVAIIHFNADNHVMC